METLTSKQKEYLEQPKERISGSEAMPKWIELDTRPQFSVSVDYKELTKIMDEIIEKISNFTNNFKLNYFCK